MNSKAFSPGATPGPNKTYLIEVKSTYLCNEKFLDWWMKNRTPRGVEEKLRRTGSATYENPSENDCDAKTEFSVSEVES